VERSKTARWSRGIRQALFRNACGRGFLNGCFEPGNIGAAGVHQFNHAELSEAIAGPSDGKE
jgi:hypothetical protein